jgi:chemotaxis protein CheZ
MDQATPHSDASPCAFDQGNVHNKIGMLTRQLHDSLRELGYADRLRGATEELPDAQNRLSYIARLTGEAAEKVLTLVDDAKDRQTDIVAQTKKMRQAMIADPVAAVAKGHIMNYLEDMEKATEIVDNQLTDIMMAQDFHDLTGQVIAKVVRLAGDLENQLVELLLQTAPQVAGSSTQLDEGEVLAAAAMATGQVATNQADDLWAAALAEAAPAPAAPTPATVAQAPAAHPKLQGPVVDPSAHDVVTSQSQVDDLLASLGF